MSILPMGKSPVNNPRVCVIGLGYVGLPICIALARRFKNVIGFDIDESRIADLKCRVDKTREVSSSELSQYTGTYTFRSQDIYGYDFYIIAVPTPVNVMNEPDLGPLVKASEIVGKSIKPGSIVVYESTVYPGCTEEVCIPILERVSGFKYNHQFFVGYSPERINPGDKEHRFENITKVISAGDNSSLDKIEFIYGSVINSPIHRAPSIKVAEMSKIIENTQRDVNVALMNEVAKICDLVGIESSDVLEASRTKWNFLNFVPGLVGGHCIGVDPYYLISKAKSMGYKPKVINSGRETNDSMGHFIAEKALRMSGKSTEGLVVSLFGFTFKENCPDIRNTKVIDILLAFAQMGVEVQISDPLADKDNTLRHYGVSLVTPRKLKPCDIAIFCVAHDDYVKNGLGYIDLSVKPWGLVLDIKNIFNRHSMDLRKIKYARL
jgi:UDP-N-acetyl-D-galactosamine dehydrogenase